MKYYHRKVDVMGRRQVVRQLVLVQPSRRFESFRPSLKKDSRKRVFFVAEGFFESPLTKRYLIVLFGRVPQFKKDSRKRVFFVAEEFFESPLTKRYLIVLFGRVPQFKKRLSQEGLFCCGRIFTFGSHPLS